MTTEGAAPKGTRGLGLGADIARPGKGRSRRRVGRVDSLAKPHMIRWARERAGLGVEQLLGKFPRIREWESGERSPTVRQLDRFAKCVHVPWGYLYFPEPPDEAASFKDFRTVDGRGVGRPSPDLIAMLHLCILRRDWYREHVLREKFPPVGFVGGLTVGTDPVSAARKIASAMGITPEAGQRAKTADAAFSRLAELAENFGILVMVSGIVGSNTHRQLDPDEFRGFAMADAYAPLVFVNGNDPFNARSFTLAHELAHLWLGESTLTDPLVNAGSDRRAEETWCNKVAGELLVPREEVQRHCSGGGSVRENIGLLARRFRIGRPVALLRLFDCGLIDEASFRREWVAEASKPARPSKPDKVGGNFCRSTIRRVGRLFAEALVPSALAGETLGKDALHLLAIRKTATIRKLAKELGMGWALGEP